MEGSEGLGLSLDSRHSHGPRFERPGAVIRASNGFFTLYLRMTRVSFFLSIPCLKLASFSSVATLSSAQHSHHHIPGNLHPHLHHPASIALFGPKTQNAVKLSQSRPYGHPCTRRLHPRLQHQCAHTAASTNGRVNPPRWAGLGYNQPSCLYRICPFSTFLSRHDSPKPRPRRPPSTPA